MSKNQPGQVVLDAIDASLDEAETIWGDSPGIEQACAELRAYRAAFKKMAEARVHEPYDEGWAYIVDDISLAKAILKARAVEARRDKATKSDIAKQTEGGIK
jgi:hypothetical protein